jgi:putative SOS response-associated peptidase YedK
MCKWSELHRLYSLNNVRIAEPGASLFDPSYNVAPTQNVPVVRLDDAGGGYVSALRWGLVPFWADDIAIGSRMINARSEEAASKPAFREAIRKRRCLIPVSGFYEWQAIKGSKARQPWYFTPSDGPVFCFAGLWESNSRATGDSIETFTILTGSPNELVRTLHDRMPCIVRPADYAAWLSPATTDMAVLSPLIAPYPADAMRAVRVSTRVNSPRNNDPACAAALV